MSELGSASQVKTRLSVLYVEDPPDQPAAAEGEWCRERATEFWDAASRVCTVRDGTGGPCQRLRQPGVVGDGCPNCPFELTFYPWFPPAMIQVALGEHYDIIVADWVASQHPGAKNVLSHREWTTMPGYREALRHIAPLVGSPKNVCGGQEFLATVRHALRDPLPFLILKTEIGGPEVRKGQREVVHATCGGSWGPLQSALLQALNFSQSQARWIGQSLAVPPPSADWSGASPTPPEGTIDFSGRKPAVRFRPGAAIEIDGNTVRLPDEVVLPMPRHSRGAETTGRMPPYRDLIRMGNRGVPNVDFRGGSWGKALGVEMGKLKEEKPFDYGVIAHLQEVCTKLDAGVRYWTAPVHIATSTDEAFRSIYHAVLGLALVYRSFPASSPEEGTYHKHFGQRRSVLSRDVQRLEYDPNSTCRSAMDLAERASQLGNDGFAGPESYADLELAFVPELIQLCLRQVARPADSIDGTARGLLDGLLQFLEKPQSPRLITWALRDETIDLLRALRKICASETETAVPVADWLFALYGGGLPWYPRVP